MRFPRPRQAPPAEGDMTPMIDMSFQLICFFLVAINFVEADRDERIHLPASELAKPPEAPFENPLTLQLTKGGTVLFLGEEVPLVAVKPLLRRERDLIKLCKGDPKRATVIVRADADAKTGVVQGLIKICQDLGFEKFALRARQKERT